MLRNLELYAANKCCLVLKYLYDQKRLNHFVTTPVFYVNSVPHLGHLYSTVLADAYCRFRAMREENSSIESIFSTGTDEHGNKIQNAAKLLGISTDDHCDNISAHFRKMCSNFSIEHSQFIRTTDIRHIAVVKHFWNKLYESGYIYKSHYDGWYCESEETFVSQSAVTGSSTSSEKQMMSLESGHPVTWTSEENYMFKLSDFQKHILNWLHRGIHNFNWIKY